MSLPAICVIPIGTIGGILSADDSQEIPMTGADDLDTPAVTILLDRLEANIERVQTEVASHGIANRPHIKTPKIPAIAHTQLDAGAVGIACQKLGEVAAFVDGGIDGDILLTFNILGDKKTDRLMELSSRVERLAVVADNETVVRGLSEAGVRHDRDVPLLIECDTGFGRNGVQTPEAARELGRFAMNLPRIRFEGLMTFPNKAPRTGEFLSQAIALFEADGIPVPVVSGGGTPAIRTLGDFPMMTEHRAGTYVYNDVMMVTAGAATWDDCAMYVRATVVSLPTPDRAVIDAGSKVLTREQYYVENFGRVVEYPDAVVANMSEEHGMIDLSRSAAKPRVGEVVNIIPNHFCVVSNMVDVVYGLRGDAVDVVWPVAARGTVR
jgi:D-serine deaminase-like pyridoxal phosphate-dependent protein